MISSASLADYQLLYLHSHRITSPATAQGLVETRGKLTPNPIDNRD